MYLNFKDKSHEFGMFVLTMFYPKMKHEDSAPKVCKFLFDYFDNVLGLNICSNPPKN